MKYQSTRGDIARLSSAEAIAGGLSRDGGLYVPESFPTVSLDGIVWLSEKQYCQRASCIMGLFLEDFNIRELYRYTRAAYNPQVFDHPDITPLHKVDDYTHFLELWHGPTAAFKDMALQVMPRLLTASLEKTNETREVCILVATSGDTGKAALEGYRDVPGTKIMVFYPRDGVSDIQRLQMTSQLGDNVNVTAVHGNFDDTQTGVKTIFSDKKLASALDKKGIFLSSANSINWGRLVPQIAYYVSAYCDLLGSGAINRWDKVNFCVPTGNFGNILAAYYAYKLGLPIGKLICASNRNDVLTQFINTGIYDKNRAFYTTISPSMDILVSSNLERLLFELSEKDGDIVTSYMSALSNCGSYDVPPSVLSEIRHIFAAGYCSEEDTLKTIEQTWREHNYLIDTHTAVAYKALRDYRTSTGDRTVTVVVSTASPFKFSDSVLKALGRDADTNIGGKSIERGIGLINALSDYTGVEAPASLLSLSNLKERFKQTVDINEMKNAVICFLEGR